MSFFRSGKTNTPPPPQNQYNRVPDVDYRPQRRPIPQPPQYDYPHGTGYNAQFENSASSRKPPPSHTGGRYVAYPFGEMFVETSAVSVLLNLLPPHSHWEIV